MRELAKTLSELGVGDIASVVGLLVGLVAVWQASRSRVAAEAAQAAARLAADRAQNIGVVMDLSVALAGFEEIKRLHRAQAWNQLPDRYAVLRKMLIDVRSATPQMQAAERKIVQDAVAQLREMERRVEKHLHNRQPEPDTPKLNSVLSQLMDRLNEVLTTLAMALKRT